MAHPKTLHSIIALIACAGIILAIIFSTNSSPDSVSLTLSPESRSTPVGETFTIDIVLNTAKQTVYGVDINRLRFDPRILEVVDIDTATPGTQITAGSLMDATVFNSADNTLGTIQFSQVMTPGTSGTNSFTGSGTLATVTFKVVAEGKSDIFIDFTPGSSTASNVAGQSGNLLSVVNGGSYKGTRSLLSTITSQSQMAAVADFNSSLVAHYTFDGNTNDGAGSNNGTASGGPTYTTGKIGQGLSLDGSDDKITFTAFNVPSSFTISTWVNPGSSQSRDWSQILGEVNTGSGLHYKRGANKISYYFSGGDHLTNGSLNAGQWHHVALVQNSGNYTFYINGSADASGTGGVSFNPYIIGHNHWGETFAGSLDDMRIYNRALDSSEVSQLYALGSGGGTPAPTPDPTPTPIPDPTPTPSPTTCSSFTYSSWGTCTNSTQSRTVTSSSPTGCTGGSPITTQSCVVTTPTPTPPVVTPTPSPIPGNTTCQAINGHKCWYVNSSATGLNNGTSWQDAWRSFADVQLKNPYRACGAPTGCLNSGDTLYISGGPSGSSRTYSGISYTSPQGVGFVFDVGHEETARYATTRADGIKIRPGQDAGHNGKVIIDAGGQVGIGANNSQYVTIDGEYNGQRNIVIRNSSAGITVVSSNDAIIRYVEIDNVSSIAISAGQTQRGGEIAYNYIHQVRGEAAINCNGTNNEQGSPNHGYDKMLIHHNEIQLNRWDPSLEPSRNAAADGIGPDGIQGCYGLSFYNNYIYHKPGMLAPRSQHPDMIQSGGAYLKVYNNVFENMTDSAVDFDSPFVGKVRIFNNIFKSTLYTGIPSGIRMYSSGTWGPFTSLDDVYILNNLFVDTGYSERGGSPIGFGAGSVTASNIHILNNIFYNSGHSNYGSLINSAASSGFTHSDFDIGYNLVDAGLHGTTNIILDGTAFTQHHPLSGKPAWVSYSEASPSNNFKLTGSDTFAIDKGTNLTNLCSVIGLSELCADAENKPRPSVGAWEIGTYEYNGSGGTPTPPPVTPPPPPPPSPLSTYYVSPSGNDSNAGTSASPFRTIQKAANIVIPGDTVVVRNGTYTDTDGNNIIATIGRGGAAGAPVTFRSENPFGAILSGNNTAGFGFIFGNNINYVNIEGFEIKDIVEAGININESNSYITIKDNRIHHIGHIQTHTLYGMSCIDVGSRAHHITVAGNTIYSCGRLNPNNTNLEILDSTCITPVGYVFPGNGITYSKENTCYNHDHGIYVRGDDINITNNTFYDMKSGWGVHVYDDAALKERITITGNTFADANPQRNGQIIIGPQTSNLRIESNIFYNPSVSAIRLGDTCAAAGLTSITIQNNSTNIGDLISGADVSCGYTISGNLLNQNFQFANEAGRDYRLISGQPIVNKPGDFNRDGAVNALDFSLLSGAWNTNTSTYDLNSDGIVNTLDYVIMVQNWTG